MKRFLDDFFFLSKEDRDEGVQVSMSDNLFFYGILSFSLVVGAIAFVSNLIQFVGGI